MRVGEDTLWKINNKRGFHPGMEIIGGGGERRGGGEEGVNNNNNLNTKKEVL